MPAAGELGADGDTEADGDPGVDGAPEVSGAVVTPGAAETAGEATGDGGAVGAGDGIAPSASSLSAMSIGSAPTPAGTSTVSPATAGHPLMPDGACCGERCDRRSSVSRTCQRERPGADEHP
jgi:hypothetical protein